MGSQSNLLESLEENILNGSDEQRVRALTRMADLFASGSTAYSDEQIDLFDDIFTCLVATIESSALSVIAARLAPLEDAPPRLMGRLAINENIEVAGPVLGKSDRLSDTVLIEVAQSRGQAHLLAIAGRTAVSSNVTDILVDRGNKAVLRSVTSNPGAQFSARGFDRLIERSVDDDDLATCLGLRDDLPRDKFLRLLSKASAQVREKLEQSVAHPTAEIDDIITKVAERIQSRSAGQSTPWSDSRAIISALKMHGRLGEDEVRAFAGAGRFIEVTASLAAMAKLPVEKVEQMFVSNHVEATLILSKVAGLSWPTARAILEMPREGAPQKVDVGQCESNFDKLKVTTAQQVVRFHQSRRAPA